MGENDKEVVYDVEVDTQLIIKVVCTEIQDMLLEKNRCYGDSAICPARIFSKSDTIEQINVRIDDKLNRIMKGTAYGDEDTELDLIGYLILKQVAKRRAKHENIKESRRDTGECACELGISRGEDPVLEDVGRTDLNPQRSDWLRGIKPRDPALDTEDKEYLPTVQRNVFSDIIAKP